MFEHLNSPEEIFSFRLGSALTMEQKLVEAMAKDGTAAIKKTDDSPVDAIVLVAATESEHYGSRSMRRSSPTPRRAGRLMSIANQGIAVGAAA
ncbi:MAG TPA: hypothetical protein VIK04_02540 [Solirubrobacteraceae bacterium]